jgi:hypothetical protein
VCKRRERERKRELSVIMVLSSKADLIKITESREFGIIFN